MADGIDWKAKAQELEHALEQAKEEFEVGNVGMIPHVFFSQTSLIFSIWWLVGVSDLLSGS
jgi:hypothetical protein